MGATVRGIPQEDIGPGVEFLSVENAAGEGGFSVTNENRALRLQGAGAVSVGFDPTTHTIRIYGETGTSYNYYYSYPSYPYYDYRTYYYTGVKLGSETTVGRIDAEGGLTSRISGSTGYIGIENGGVAGINLKLFTKEENVYPGVGLGWYVEDDKWFHLSFGVWDKTTYLNDYYTTFFRSAGKVYRTLGYYNNTAQIQKFRVTFLTSSSITDPKYSVMYNSDNGQIMAALKEMGDLTAFTTTERIPPNLGDFPCFSIDNHPDKEAIFENSAAYFLDVQTWRVEKK
jgi:hypothetical protein